MGGQSGLSELSVILWMSTFEGCPLSGVPLYNVHAPDSSHEVLEIVDCCNVVVVHFDFHIRVDPPGREESGGRRDGGRRVEGGGWREERWREESGGR